MMIDIGLCVSVYGWWGTYGLLVQQFQASGIEFEESNNRASLIMGPRPDKTCDSIESIEEVD